MAEQGVSSSFACLYGNLESWVSDTALSSVEGKERLYFIYTTVTCTNLSMKYLVMCNVYTDVRGIK